MNTTGMSFGGGFASGVANALSQKREQDRKNEDREIANNWKLMQIAIDSQQVGGIEDLMPALQNLNLGLGKGKGGKGGGMDPTAHVTNVLGHILRNGKGSPEGRGTDAGPMVGATPLPGAQQPPQTTGPNDAGQVMPPTELPSRGLPQPAVQAPPQPSFMGIPLMSQAQVAQRKVDLEGVTTEAQIRMRKRMAEQLGYEGKDALEYALNWKPSAGRYGTTPQIGTLGDFIKRTEAEAGHTLTPAEVETARRDWTAASQSMGLWAERAAGVLGFTNASEARAMGKGVELDAKAQELQTAAGGSLAGAQATARGEAQAKAPLSTPQKFEKTQALRTEYNKETAASRTMAQHYKTMEQALASYEANPAAAAEAIRVAFEKALDPQSVVREGEYNRQSDGLSLWQRMEGFKQALAEGGGKIPKEQLASMVALAGQFSHNQDDYASTVKDSILGQAQDFGLNPDRIFGVGGWNGAAAPAKAASPATKPGAYVLKDGKWVRPSGTP